MLRNKTNVKLAVFLKKALVYIHYSPINKYGKMDPGIWRGRSLSDPRIRVKVNVKSNLLILKGKECLPVPQGKMVGITKSEYN